MINTIIKYKDLLEITASPFPKPIPNHLICQIKEQSTHNHFLKSELTVKMGMLALIKCFDNTVAKNQGKLSILAST